MFLAKLDRVVAGYSNKKRNKQRWYRDYSPLYEFSIRVFLFLNFKGGKIMNEVKIGKVYRHFKGNYYFVENVGLDSETQEKVVIYKPLYERQDSRNLGKKRENVLRRN